MKFTLVYVLRFTQINAERASHRSEFNAMRGGTLSRQPLRLCGTVTSTAHHIWFLYDIHMINTSFKQEISLFGAVGAS